MKRFTCRRLLIDNALEANKSLIKGFVVDIGGKKVNKRGDFRLPENIQCVYVNIDPNTQPDILCDAAKIPIQSSSVDTVLLCEILEHLRYPDKVLTEAHRLLRKNGILIGTVPFLYPIHADPHDYQRWTEYKISEELKQTGFHNIKVLPMGGAIAVLIDVFKIHISERCSKNIFRILDFAVLVFQKILWPIISKPNVKIPTGYLILCTK